MSSNSRDPTAPHRAAPFLAQLVACGMIGRAEALAALLHARAPARVSVCLRQARLAPPIGAMVPGDHRNPVSSGRSQAAKAARSALTPLLRANASRAVLAAAATQAARPALQRTEIEAVLTEALGRHLRKQRPKPTDDRPAR